METSRKIRHDRIRKTVKGSAKTPRLSVFRSDKHIYAQIINDEAGATLTAVSTLSKDFKGKNMKSTNKDAAAALGELLAQKALEKGIKEVCFDRGGYKYHGRVKSLADGARKGGLKF